MIPEEANTKVQVYKLIEHTGTKPVANVKHIMNKENITTGLNITRERMIQLLNEDLAGEYQAIIAYTVYSQVLKGAAYTDIARELEAHAGEELAHAIKIAKQIDYLGGMPSVTPKPVKTSSDPIAMLRADLENERETVGRYRERIRQAEAMGEFALSETLRGIIVQEQEHEIDLSAALDINVPPAKTPVEQNNGRNRVKSITASSNAPLV
jgi:bacterioferritin